MNTLTAWILSILGIVILGTVIDLILPSGRMNKYIRSIFAAVTIVIIILPLPNLIKNGFKFDGGFISDKDFVLDEDFIDYADRFKFSYMEKGMEKTLTDEGLKNTKVSIKGEFKGSEIIIKEVRINLTQLVIDEKLEHINKYELIEKLVTTSLKVNKGVIVLDE